MIRRPPRSTLDRSSAASDVYKRQMHVGSEDARNVLVGAADVITPDFYITHRRTGLWKNHAVKNLEVLNSTDNGALAGEGSAFFVLDLSLIHISEPTRPY